MWRLMVAWEAVNPKRVGSVERILAWEAVNINPMAWMAPRWCRGRHFVFRIRMALRVGQQKFCFCNGANRKQ